jgi:hypothetical protein
VASPWDYLYEHCLYFTKGSLARLFTACGFEVLRIWSRFDSQLLTIDAQPADGSEAPPKPQPGSTETERLLLRFASRHATKLDSWRLRLATLHREGETMAIWGAGARGAMFLNTADDERRISWAVDVNPRKHGHFVAGTGQRIVAPQELNELRPQVILIMNRAYEAEIRSALAGLGLDPQILVV